VYLEGSPALRMGIVDDAPGTKAERAGPDVLRAVAGVTGGRTFPIYDLKKLEMQSANCLRKLRSQYLIAHHLTRWAQDG
jgi:hypothetical protein